MPSELHCRVCGLKQLQPPWGTDGNCPSFEICPCCGVEFGYDDATLGAIQRYRAKWLELGASWFLPDERPSDWSLDEQMAEIPSCFR